MKRLHWVLVAALVLVVAAAAGAQMQPPPSGQPLQTMPFTSIIAIFDAASAGSTVARSAKRIKVSIPISTERRMRPPFTSYMPAAT